MRRLVKGGGKRKNGGRRKKEWEGEVMQRKETERGRRKKE